MINRNCEKEVGRGRALNRSRTAHHGRYLPRAWFQLCMSRIIYGKIHLDDTTHQRTIIFRELFSGHVLASRLKKRKEKRARNTCELVMLLNEKKIG